ncbi:39S ribosomal protein L48, mitochondrial-like [Mizuhopecten yessoensis]|uniref:39S ribosomal protein L48, mitochondrial-like n=1 Tax=Mizuhopecten yessoensis TaxID=6573 RepID=UPI000B45F6DC|nr:39S ribosomal protein L48, mitochondrial-like [Mizuhopecten yessoensis]
MKMYSYDCTVLDSFANYAKQLATGLEMDVFLYPVPRQTHVIKTYLPYSTIVKNQYTMDTYERVIRMHSLQSTKLPIFIEIMRRNIPSGIDIQFKQHTEEDDVIRYMGDQERKDILSKLDDVQVKRG